MTPRGFLDRAANRLKDLLFLPGTETYWTKRLSGRVLALLYHRVVDEDRYGFLSRGGTPTISLEQFESDIEFLNGLGAVFLTFDDLRRGAIPKNNSFGVAINFDDGFLDTYRVALPSLEARGIRGTVFQCTAMVDANRMLLEHQYYWWGASDTPGNELARLAKQRGWPVLPQPSSSEWSGLNPAPWICTVPLAELEHVRGLMEAAYPIPPDLPEALYPTREDITDAFRRGHEIGSHGHGHFHRLTMTTDEFDEDIAQSASALREILGPRPLAYSFPYAARMPGDSARCLRHFDLLANVEARPIDRNFDPSGVPRATWPATSSRLRNRRWLLSGEN